MPVTNPVSTRPAAECTRRCRIAAEFRSGCGIAGSVPRDVASRHRISRVGENRLQAGELVTITELIFSRMQIVSLHRLSPFVDSVLLTHFVDHQHCVLWRLGR